MFASNPTISFSSQRLSSPNEKFVSSQNLLLTPLETRFRVEFCVVSGSPCYYIKWYQRKGRILFLIRFLLEEVGRRTSLDSKRQQEEWRHVNACYTLAQRPLDGLLNMGVRIVSNLQNSYGSLLNCAILDLYSNPRQMHSITVRIPRPLSTPVNRWQFWLWPSVTFANGLWHSEMVPRCLSLSVLTYGNLLLASKNGN